MMLRTSAIVLFFSSFLACSSPPAALTQTQEAELEKRNAALIKQHDEIWNLMGLSLAAKKELNAIVVNVNSQMMKNKIHKPQAFAKASAVYRASRPLTHDEYIANHRKRFDMLKISAPTQKELLAASEFVWTALHDKDAKLTEEQRATALTIQTMMRKMKGPPPCCDDNIFKRAAQP